MNLLQAAEHIDLELATRLIESKEEINAYDEFGQTALHIAIDIAFEEAIRIYDTEGRYVEPQMDMIELLISNGADHRQPDKQGETPMDWAIKRNHERFIQKLEAIIAKHSQKEA